MKTYQTQASLLIETAPELVYQVLADYRNGHPRILPESYFSSLVVEEGGTGAGTVIRTTMTFMGAVRELRMFVTEPDPGRVLQEEDPGAGVKTQFRVEPLPGGKRCEVTIHSVWVRQPGVRGWVDQLLNPPVGRLIYRQELALLKEYCESEGK